MIFKYIFLIINIFIKFFIKDFISQVKYSIHYYFKQNSLPVLVLFIHELYGIFNF